MALCVVLMLLSKNNSTGVLIVQTVILLAVLAILIVVLLSLLNLISVTKQTLTRKQAVARCLMKISRLKIKRLMLQRQYELECD